MPSAAHRTALITGSLLSGAMLSLSLVAVPVLLDTTTSAPQLLHSWVRMYHYGHLALPNLAVGTSILYAYAANKVAKQRLQQKSGGGDGGSRQWQVLALAAIATVAMVPFTWLVMVPTNSELFMLQAASVGNADVVEFADVRELVVSWSRMHLTRSLMPLVGAVLGALASV